MKPIRIVLAPTRSRPVNIFLGMVLLLVSLLLFLALATYHATDPSLNTATGTVTPHNWIGLFGAYLSDLLLQALGITAFLLPMWLGGVGWTWMRSRPGGSPILRWMGTLLALTFLPAVLGLLPWHWRWLHVVPIEGVVGRLMAGLLVVYLNLQGAWVVAAALAAAGLYFASDISFGTIREIVAERWAQFAEWRDRRRDLREEEEELEARRGALSSEGNGAIPFSQFDAAANPEMETEIPAQKPNRFLAFFMRRRAPKQDPIDEIPAYQRVDSRADQRPRTEEPAVMPRRSSIWEHSEAETGHAARYPTHAPMTAAVVAAATVAPIRLRAAPPAPVDPWANEPADSRSSAARACRRNCDSQSRRCRSARRDRGAQARERLQAAVEHAAERGRGAAIGARGRVARRSQGAGGKMRRVRCARPGGADQPRPHGHHLRVQARSRREILARHRPGRRPVPGHARRKHFDRAHARQKHGRHPGAEPRERNHSPARRDRERNLRPRAFAAHARHGQGHQWPHRDRRSGLDAARAHRRFHGIGQIRGHQRHDHEPALSHHAAAGAAHPGRSQARGAGHVRGHPASLHAHHHRAQAGRQRAAQCRARNGAAPEAAGLAQRAQHRPVQQALRGFHAFTF